MEGLNKYEVLKNILEDVQNEIFDEDIIHTLLEQKVSKIRRLKKTH